MRVLSQILLRAPLLPVSALGSSEPLADHPLGELALRLASPSLSAHGDGRAAIARRRYGRRAAFRATPSGLLAGVSLAELGEGPSRIALGDPGAHLAPRYARVAALGRALLDTEAGWRAARMRVAPSLLKDDARLCWIGYGDGAEARRMEAELDPALARVLEACADWILAPRLLVRLRGLLGDADATRSFLLELLDDGLLHHDLEPPLVGPAPVEFARTRYARLCPEIEEIAALSVGTEGDAAQREARLRARLAVLPGGELEAPLLATLVHRGDAPLVIARAPVERAARLAPTLFALAEALAPPLAEAELVPGLEEALATASAVVGEGALPLAALELGHYGLAPAGAQAGARRSPDPAVQAWMTGLVLEAARASREEVELTEAELREHLPVTHAPASFELQLAPCTGDGGEGRDWLLGLHGPAGATWGRFAHALGRPMLDALEALRDAEGALDEGALRVDVSYAPSAELADLCAVPALRQAALALSSWPEGGAVLPSQCAIGNEPLGPAHRALRVAERALVTAPLSRVRSTTVPPCATRALLGDSLLRQHAPWALPWGPLAGLPWLPRVRLEGFVIAPQSWSLPAHDDEAALLRWRVRGRVPRHVMVGAEDLLLPLDLDEPADRAQLAALAREEGGRVYEIWPPLGRELDEGGRRVELVCAVLDEEAAARTRVRHERVEALVLAPPPSTSPPRPGWRTLKIYAPRDRHAHLLAAFIGPLLAKQRKLRTWFFLPYVEEGSGREQLRLRVAARDEASVAQLAERLRAGLETARAQGELATIEIGAYQPEHARYGEALTAVERVFASDSRMVMELLGEEAAGLAPEVLLTASFDALARGLGLTQPVIERRVGDALEAYRIDEAERRAELAPAYRALQRPLLELLAAPDRALRAHRSRLRAVKLERRAAERLLPTLMHLAAVRLCGTDREVELRALYLYARALESQRARRARPRADMPRRAR